MTNTNTLKFKTRISKGADAHETLCDLVWDDVTDEQLKALAERSIIIMVQSQYRTAGKVPATDTVNIADMLKRDRSGFKATPESIAKKVGSMTAEQKAQLIAMLTAGDD